MRIIALFGPTGVGKTAVAVALAELLRAQGEDPVAVSADALQVYAGLEILTGVASPAERARLEHRLVSFLPVDATFSAGQYAQLAHAEVDDLLAAGRRPIVVGGTGLYLRAALTELSLRPPPPEGVRERWTAELERSGAPALHAMLVARAPWAAEKIDPNDRQRLVRALELFDLGELEPPEGPSQLWSEDLRHPTLLVGSEDGARGAVCGDRRARRGDAGGGRGRGGSSRECCWRVRDGAQGAGFRGAVGGRRGIDEAAHAQLRQAPAHVDAQAGGRAHDGRDAAATRPRSRGRS